MKIKFNKGVSTCDISEEIFDILKFSDEDDKVNYIDLLQKRDR